MAKKTTAGLRRLHDLELPADTTSIVGFESAMDGAGQRAIHILAVAPFTRSGRRGILISHDPRVDVAAAARTALASEPPAPDTDGLTADAAFRQQLAAATAGGWPPPGCVTSYQGDASDAAEYWIPAPTDDPCEIGPVELSAASRYGCDLDARGPTPAEIADARRAAKASVAGQVQRAAAGRRCICGQPIPGSAAKLDAGALEREALQAAPVDGRGFDYTLPAEPDQRGRYVVLARRPDGVPVGIAGNAADVIAALARLGYKAQRANLPATFGRGAPRATVGGTFDPVIAGRGAPMTRPPYGARVNG